MKLLLRRRDLARMVLGLSLALAAGGAWALGQRRDGALGQAAQAEQAFQNERFDQALTLYGTAVAQGPTQNTSAAPPLMR